MKQFKAIESVRMRATRAKRKKEMGKEIKPGRARLGKKMDQLVIYTSLVKRGQVKLVQVKSSKDRSSLVKTGQVWSRQVKSI